MKIFVVGGGPAGLYFSFLLKRHFPKYYVELFEQNSPTFTFGFGVVFSNRALEFLRKDDEETYQYLYPHMEAWPELTIVHRDEHVSIDGNGFNAIGRLRLLDLLRERCAQEGVTLNYGRSVNSVDELSSADVIIAADGVNSFIRSSFRKKFRTSEHTLRNPYIWYGTTRLFDSLSLTFRENDDGVFCAHHYRYGPSMSTFIVETDPRTFKRANLKSMNEDETKAYCEKVFAHDLGGHSLFSNGSTWRWFPQIWNDHWFHGNIILIGDALHTAHFSIGSGTRLAMEDATALLKSFRAYPGDHMMAARHFEMNRKPVLEKLVEASMSSAQWYEQMAVKMENLNPHQLAHSYMTRTGRVSDQRLEKIAPGFMRRYREKNLH